MAILDKFAAAKIGPTYTTNNGAVFPGGGSLNLLALLSKDPGSFPILFVIYSTFSFNLRLIANSTADNQPNTNDFLLLPNTYWPLVIENPRGSSTAETTLRYNRSASITISSTNYMKITIVSQVLSSTSSDGFDP